jgi:hypothetical protein
MLLQSTLGHNTINQDGKRQSTVSGECDLFYKGSMFDAASGIITDIYPKTTGRRTVILFDNGIVFDYMNIKSDESHTYHNVYMVLENLMMSHIRTADEIFQDEDMIFYMM